MSSNEEFGPEQYTKYEKARILGARALQISAGAPILIKLSKEELESLNYDPTKIAELEFEQKVLPITVKRPLPKKIEAKIEEPVEIVKEEKEIKKVPKEEGVVEEKAKVEEAEEIEAEAEEAGTEELGEEEVIEEFSKEEAEESE